MPAPTKKKPAAATESRPTRTAAKKPSSKEPPSVLEALASPSHCDNELAARLATQLHIDPPPPPKKATTSASKPTKPAAKTRPVASKAGPSRPTKPKELEVPPPTPKDGGPDPGAPGLSPLSEADRLKLAMNAYNAASQSLAQVVQSGWKRSASSPSGPAKPSKGPAKPPPTYSIDNVLAIVSSCQVALRGLRAAATVDRVFDIEKAAIALVGKLISMELYESAVSVLSGMKPVLLTLYDHENLPTEDPSAPPAEPPAAILSKVPPSRSTLSSQASSPPSFPMKDHLSDHCLPLPEKGRSPDPSVLYLLLMFQYNAVTALARLNQSNTSPTFDKVLTAPGNLLDWYRVYSASAAAPELSQLPSVLNTLARTVSSADSSDPAAVLWCRQWAMKCLVPSGAVEVEKFWDQTTRCARSFVGADTSSPKDDVARQVCSFFQDIIQVVELSEIVKTAKEYGGVRASEVLFKGTGFVAACEYWLRFAKYLNDIPQMNEISRLLDVDATGAAGPSSPSPAPSAKSSGKKMTPAQIRLVVSRAATVLQQLVDSDSRDELSNESLEHVEEAISVIPQCSAHVLSLEGDGRKKLIRSIDDLSRVGEKVLRAANTPRDIRKLMQSLMGSLVKYGEQVLKGRADNNTATPYVDTLVESVLDGTLDALFVLAKTALLPSDNGRMDPDGANKAYSHLQKALSLAQIPPPSSSSSSGAAISEAVRSLPDDAKLRYASTLRSISTSFHNAAATLMNGGREAASVAFWRKSAEVGAEALQVREAISEVSEEDQKVWDSLRDKYVPYRLDILAYCLAKTGERKQAHATYIQCLQTRPRSSYDNVVSLARTSSIRVVFQAEPKLASTIEKITSLAAFDLLSSEGATLRRPLEDIGLTPEVVGAVLEFQVLVLEPMLHKEEAAGAVKTLLKDLKEVYHGTGEFPVRRARVLLRALEFAYSMDDTSMAPSPLVVHGLLGSKASIRSDHFFTVVLTCERLQNLGMDTQLATFVPQYSVSLEILLALQAHRHQDGENSTPIILQHATKAIKALRSMFQVQTAPPPAKGKKAAAAPKKTTKAPARTPKPVPATRTRAPVPAKTPKKPSNVEALADAVASLKLDQPLEKTILDDGEQFYRKLESLSHLLGVLGHFLPKVELLDAMCKLCEATVLPNTADGFMQASVAIAQEYIKLGKTDHASAVFARAVQFAEDPSNNVSDEVRVVFFLRHAESLAVVGTTDVSLALYEKARSLCEKIAAPDKSAPVSERIKFRVGELERSAMAACAYSAIQLSRDNAAASISGLLQALRLWNRAVDTLTRLRQPAQSAQMTASSTSESDNPFQVPMQASSASDSPPTKPAQPRMWDSTVDGLQWRLADGVIDTLFALGRIHFLRGSVKTSEFFIQKANDLAISLNAPVLLSRALAREAEKQLMLGQLDAGHELLLQATYPWEQVPGVVGPDLADLHRLQGNHSLRADQPEEAKRIYGEANKLLDELERLFADTESVLVATPSQELGQNAVVLGASTMVPALLASILRQHIWLLRGDAGDDPLFDDLLARFQALPATVETKVEENALMGKLAFEEVQARLENDLFLSSLIESAVALPMGMSSCEGVTPPTSTREILASLANAERFFWSGLELSSERGEVHQVREAAVSLMLIRAYQTSLGKGGKNGAIIAAALLDISAAITLRRELIECIDYKFQDPLSFDDLVWPTMNVNGSPLPPVVPAARRLAFADESDDDEPDSEASLKAYWQSVKRRYRSEAIDAAGLAASPVDTLPEHWTIVNISVTDDKSTLLISRQRPQREPLIFCLPLDRQGRREGDDDEEHFSYETAIEEFQDIIHSSDETTKSAKDLTTKEERAGWWADRSKLDLRMKELLENIEYCWLGAFKTILSEPTGASPESLNALRSKFDKVFRRNGIVSQEKKNQLHVRLDDDIVECFSTLSSKCRDEEIEDFIYFVLDLYQLHGAPVALSEIDIDQVAVDLRAVLDEHHSKGRSQTPTTDDPHLFLVLDKNLQGLPWESIPTLRGRSVSRIPSISFLIDRVELVRHQRGPSRSTAHNCPDRTTVDPLKTFYVLNPAGDLKTTQATYEPGFKELERLGWSGVTGRPPTEEEMLQGLQRSDLFLYFGHGGAQMYLRSHKLRNLPKCAVTMLWGCSSGLMKDMGDFDRVGTPNHYMVAGCPTLVANLWDVTDREIDRIAQNVLTKLRINKDHLGQKGKSRDEGTSTSVVRAVAESREVCKLKYLTGAAPVVYGIPFYL